MYTIAMLLHECAHYRVALSRRYKCNSMKLSAFGAVLYGKFDDVNPDDAMAIALAGPCANIVAAVICLALWWTIPSAYVFTDVFFNANVSMALVNLLPCYPLDGGRIVGALWDKKGKSGYDNSRRLTAVISAVMFAGVRFVGVFALRPVQYGTVCGFSVQFAYRQGQRALHAYCSLCV